MSVDWVEIKEDDVFVTLSINFAILSFVLLLVSCMREEGDGY